MIIDTHIHLDDKRYEEDLEAVIKRAKEGGVERFIIPGADPDTLDRAVSIAQKYEDVYFAVGVHPYDLEKFDEEIFHRYLPHPKCVGVGECGLDYFRLEGTQEEKERVKKAQKEVFVAQIALAKEYKKPLIVHIRDASLDSKTVLLENDACEVGGVLHCFNADEQLLSLAECGFYFGIGGIVTFKNARKLIQVLPKIPLERMIIETDGPYLTPEPYRGKRNEPLYTTYVAQKIADLLEKSRQEIEEITTQNAKKLFDIS
ncbi:Putative deoxyribonuclease YcfH [hydrothermal vent metagenome]|uniref:Putative deoxyribonuclease YcfH n=1 Tax=hydrothermal vent metagenome TaxID=652676 RepID=A0A1W1BG45_9ZZZZ